MPFWFISRILCNVCQIHSETSRFIKKTHFSSCPCHSLPKIHFCIATPEIPAWSMLYEFKVYFIIQVERVFKTQFTLTHLSLKLYIAYYPFILETQTVSIWHLTLHCRWSTNYLFFTTVQWIWNVMFVNVVYVILRCKTSCKPRNFAVSPV